MKKRVGLIIAVIAAVLVICLLTWRFLPQSSSEVLSVDETSITGFSASAMIQRLENGQTLTKMYRIDNVEQQSNDPREVLEILAASNYQPDFRNLLLWNIDSVDADKSYDGRTVILVFSVGSQKDEYVEVMFLSSSMIVVSVGGEDHFRVYHPTNRETIDKLIEYLQTHGAKQ